IAGDTYPSVVVDAIAPHRPPAADAKAVGARVAVAVVIDFVVLDDPPVAVDAVERGGSVRRAIAHDAKAADGDVPDALARERAWREVLAIEHGTLLADEGHAVFRRDRQPPVRASFEKDSRIRRRARDASRHIVSGRNDDQRRHDRAEEHPSPILASNAIIERKSWPCRCRTPATVARRGCVPSTGTASSCRPRRSCC